MTRHTKPKADFKSPWKHAYNKKGGEIVMYIEENEGEGEMNIMET